MHDRETCILMMHRVQACIRREHRVSPKTKRFFFFFHFISFHFIFFFFFHFLRPLSFDYTGRKRKNPRDAPRPSCRSIRSTETRCDGHISTTLTGRACQAQHLHNHMLRCTRFKHEHAATTRPKTGRGMIPLVFPTENPLLSFFFFFPFSFFFFPPLHRPTVHNQTASRAEPQANNQLPSKRATTEQRAVKGDPTDVLPPFCQVCQAY